jgi:hypothetical protein
LGTTNKPVDGPHDLDFVLQLDAPYWHWNPVALLLALYEYLKSNEKYREMTTLKNRVVRLTYADDFYMDILPVSRAEGRLSRNVLRLGAPTRLATRLSGDSFAPYCNVLAL